MYLNFCKKNISLYLINYFEYIYLFFGMLFVFLYIVSIIKSNLININYFFNVILFFCVEIYFWYFKREYVFIIFKGMY